MRLLTIGIVFATLGCGKVGDPLPPFVRIPERVQDLSVEQRGYNLYFKWTNPIRNIDQSRSDDLAEALLSTGGEVVAKVSATEPGLGQHLNLDGRAMIGLVPKFTLRFETERGRASEPSNEVSIEVVDVAGSSAALDALVDQGVVMLEWEPPSSLSEFAEAYRIYRSGELLTDFPAEGASFEDRTFQVGETYTYTVVAVRRVGENWVEGFPSEPLLVTATDQTAPGAPEGLTLIPAATGAFLNWQSSPESDVIRYRVFRKPILSGEFEPLDEPQITTAFFDAEFRLGYQYVVSAIDDSGNESPQSEAIPR